MPVVELNRSEVPIQSGLRRLGEVEICATRSVRGSECAGRDVLIVDDIIDTGRTLTELAGLIQLQQPRSISTVALVNKTSRRAADAEPTYSGLEIGEDFI